MRPPAKDLDINIYRKFQAGKEGVENQYVSQNRLARSPLARPAAPEDAATLKELTHCIQVMQNRLKYIESAKAKNEKLLESTLQKTQNFLAARSRAEESSRKLSEVRAREESQQSALRSRATELQSAQKLGTRSGLVKEDKLRQAEQTKAERQDIQRQLRQAQEEEALAKRSKVLSIKGKDGRAQQPEKLSRRGSTLNLDSTLNRTLTETRRRPNHSTAEKGPSPTGPLRPKSRNC